MSSIDPDLRRYYAERAPYYDAVYAKPERAADLAFLHDWVPAQLDGRRVLEVACGTGYWTPRIAARAREVVATDATAEPLAFARLRPGAESVRFLEADAHDLPASLGAFDGAFAGLWLSHVPRKRLPAFFAGLHARLVPGAVVVLVDNNEVQLKDFPIAETDADGDTFQHRVSREGITHRVLKNFPTGADLESLVAGAADGIAYRNLDNFWTLRYRLR